MIWGDQYLSLHSRKGNKAMSTETAKQLSDWDKQIIADMERHIAAVQAALDAGPNVGALYRPKIGDAKPQSKAHWEVDIAQTRAWINKIINGK
jgi:hypothetical protein